MSRKLALCALALLVIVPFGKVSAQQKEQKKLRANVFRIDAASAAARAQGFFAAEGLGLEVTETANSTEQMLGLIQGKFELVAGGFDNVLAWSGREGVEIVAIAQVSDTAVFRVIVRPEIKTWADLKGKKTRRRRGGYRICVGAAPGFASPWTGPESRRLRVGRARYDGLALCIHAQRRNLRGDS